MANPYEVRTAVPAILQGLGTVNEAYVDRESRRREMQAAEEKASAQKAVMDEGAQLLTEGTPDQVAQFGMKNPEAMKAFIQAADFRDDLTSKPRLDLAIDVVTGRVNPREAYEARIAEIESKGGTAQMTREWLDKQSDEDILAMAEKDIAALDYDKWESLSSAMAKGQDGDNKFGTYNPRDYTTESWSEFVKTGNESALKRYEKPRGMTASGEKALISSQDKFMKLTEQARESELLADDFEGFASSLPAGTAATVNEFFKAVGGSQDEATELRRRFNKIRLGEALKYLPPGPATDRDVEEAFKGVPRENASPEQVVMFLRGSAKLARINAEFEEFKSSFISERGDTRDLIKEWKRKLKDGEVQSVNEIGEMQAVDDQAEELPNFNPQQKQAYDWAVANAQDPRAAAILQKLGVQ